jgi:hypothetical protein
MTLGMSISTQPAIALPSAEHSEECATDKDAVKPGSARVTVSAAETTAGVTVASTRKFPWTAVDTPPAVTRAAPLSVPRKPSE